MKRNILFFFLMVCLQVVYGQSYHGSVIGKDDRTPISDATVQLFYDNVFLGGAKTRDDGTFEAPIDKVINKVVVTCLGYERFVKTDTLAVSTDIGVIELSSKSVQLKDVVVKGSLRKQEMDKDIYVITDSLRKGIVSSAQLIEKLPGVLRDWSNDNLIIDGVKEDIIILVNNVEQGANYAMKLNPKRIKQIEITHNPLGKYSDKKVLVNISLYDDYKGWDLTPYSYLQYGKANMNKENLGVSFTYSINKFSFNISSNLVNDATRDSKEQTSVYFGKITQKSAPMDKNVANDKDDELLYNLSVGAEYRMAKNHSLSVQLQGSYNQGNNRQNYLFSVESSDGKYEKEQMSKIKDYSGDYTAGLFYRGTLWKKSRLNSDLTYNYYSVKKTRTFIDGENNCVNPTLGRKDYVRYNVNLSTPISKYIDWYVDYSWTWRKYDEKDRNTGNESYYSKNVRHNLLGMLTWHPFEKFSLSGGLQWIGSRDDNNEGETSDYSLNPLFRLYYKPWNNVAIRSNFELSTSAPNLEKLSSTEYQVDSWIWQKGNPLLKNSTFISWESYIFIDKIVTIACQYFKNKNSHEYLQYSLVDDNKIVRSYFNTDWSRLCFSLSGKYKIFKDFYFGGDVYYSNDGIVDVDGKNKHTDVYMGDLLGQYTINSLKLKAQMVYQYIEEHHQTIQGTGLSKIDLAKFTLVRPFFHDKLQVSVTAICPVGLFKREIYQTTNTQFYTRRFDATLNKATGPFVNLNLRLYLNGGKQTRMTENRFVVDSEK